jgi:hypothetical protein
MTSIKVHCSVFLPKNALYKITKGHGLSVSGFWFRQIYYVDDIIIFSLTPENHMHHMWEVFGRLKEHNLKFHLGKCRLFHTQVQYLGHMIYLGGLGFKRPRLRPFHKFPNQ